MDHIDLVYANKKMVITDLPNPSLLNLITTKSGQERADSKSVYYFVGIDGARFKKPVSPGDQLHLDVSLIAKRRGLWKFAGKATVDGVLAAEAEIMCTMRSA